jgi:NAD(P)-dependent dehydrogenase (short-subunit alcohol dehydrogenase family)
MENQWKNKSAVITGSARGLGFALAERLSAWGVSLAMLDVQKELLEEAGQKLSGNVHTYAADVTDEQQVKNVIDDFASKTQKIDILINCAGIVGETNRKSHEVEIEDFEKVMAVNVKGCFTTFKAVIPHMLEQNYGRVLHTASIAGKEGNAGMLPYSTSKAAVIGMTKVQGKEYAETGITVNAIAPAVIWTDMVETQSPEQIKYMTDKIPMKRCGEIREYVDMVCFIVSEQSSFTTGFTYDLTGGRATY